MQTRTSRRDLLVVGVGALAAGGLAGRMQALIPPTTDTEVQRAEQSPGGMLGERFVVQADVHGFGSILQSRIAAVSAVGGGTIDIVNGASNRARLDRTILLPPNIRIRGQGKGATEIWIDGDFPAFASADPSARTDNCELSNLRISRFKSSSTTPIIDWSGISHSRLQDLVISQGSVRGQSIGIAFGASSYYNDISSVQVRGTHIGMSFRAEANANRVVGNNAVLHSDYGFVVDKTNSTLFLGASVEACEAVGFCFRNGSKQNQVLACRVEDVPIGYQTVYGTDGSSSAFDNYFIANVGYPRDAGRLYDLPTSNTLIDSFATQLSEGTFIEAVVGVRSETIPVSEWRIAKYDDVRADTLVEYERSSSTVRLKSGGIFRLAASALLDTSHSGARLELSVFVNGAEHRRLDMRESTVAAQTQLSGSADMSLRQGDALDIRLRTTGIGVALAEGAASVLTVVKQS